MPQCRRALLIEEMTQGKKQALQLIVEGGAQGVPEDGGRRPVIGQGRGQRALAHAPRSGQADGPPCGEGILGLGQQMIAPDEKSNRARTVLVIASIAVGIFAVGRCNCCAR